MSAITFRLHCVRRQQGQYEIMTFTSPRHLKSQLWLTFWPEHSQRSSPFRLQPHRIAAKNASSLTPMVRLTDGNTRYAKVLSCVSFGGLSALDHNMSKYFPTSELFHKFFLNSGGRLWNDFFLTIHVIGILSLVPERFELHFRKIIFKLWVIDDWIIFWEIGHSNECHWTLLMISQHWFRCHQAPNNYLSQYWPRSMLPFGVIRPQWD